MITRTLVAGAWWGDMLPTGEYCALVPELHVLTHLGPIGFPLGEPWGVGYPRCTNVNGFRFAGQAHSTLDPATWEWDTAHGGWVPYAPPCCGVSPVIYDRDGVLHRSDCGPGVGSQGYRFVTPANVIVTGDQTYGPFNGLFEYTELGDFMWIGQAAYDGGGVQVWSNGALLQLELGDCRFIRANREGEAVALAFTRPEGVVLMSLTMADLRALPPVVTPQPPTVLPTFRFTHPVLLRPFRAQGSGVPDIDTLGVYTEGALPDPMPSDQRLILAHDGPDAWTPPPGLRTGDVALIELYRLKSETLAQSASRWLANTTTLLSGWPYDCGVIPPFYGQGGAPPNELWTVQEVLDALNWLDEVVNRSPRLKVIAPFAYARANGIVAHEEFQQAFDRLVAACALAGEATLLPMGGGPDPEPPDPEPTPTPDPHQAIPFKDIMTPKPVTFRLGAFYARVDPTPNLTPWPGWFRIVSTSTDPSTASTFTLSQPDAGGPFQAVSDALGGLLTMDFTEFGGNVCQGFYLSPADAGWGAYQQLNGWQLGPGGPEVLLVQYPGDRLGQCAPCLTVVRL